MRLPIEWLKDYVDVDITPEELAHKLTMAGITIEGIERLENDTILDLDLTPNRGDCYGIINVAREVAAVTGAPLHLPQSTPDENEEKIEDSVSVTIKDSDLCRRYAARLVRNIRLAPSPSWMRERLENSGIRAINNIVDVTNYVMLETNQPLHAFDYDLLKNGSIVVRRAQKGEKIDTLDGQEREIDQDTLIIADNERPVALAGVMGGANSEINDSTITVLLESANFDGVSIRKTSKKVGLRTESSIRFEKGVDIEGVIFAVDRAARLIEILGAGEVVKGVIDAYPAPQEPRLITLRPARVNHVLGTNLSENEIVAYLRQLDFEVEPSGEQFLVSVPSYRPDLEIEEDLIEEVARLYGYDNIPTSLTRGTPTQGHLDGYQAFQDRVVDVISRWMRQVVTYSFINPRWLDTLMVPQEDELRNTLVIANPFSDEQGIMRTTLVPGLFDAMNRNLARRNEDLAIFELGNVFRPCQKGLPDEVLMLGGIVVGKTNPGWQGKTVDMDFYFLKGIIEEMFREINVNGIEFVPGDVRHTYHPGRTAAIIYQGEKVGYIGEIHPSILSSLDIKKRPCLFELSLGAIFKGLDTRIRVKDVSKYPDVKRDLALVVNEDVPAADLFNTIRVASGDLLKNVDLFDIYRSVELGEGLKSLAFSLSFQSYQGTLQDDEVNILMQKVIARAAEVHQARLR